MNDNYIASLNREENLTWSEMTWKERLEFIGGVILFAAFIISIYFFLMVLDIIING